MDMVYVYTNTAEKMAQKVVEEFRGQGKSITFRFRIDHSCYDSEGEDIGPNIYFDIRYITPKGSSYVKVDWTPFSYREQIVFWQQLANHDSCWRGCWDEPLEYGRKKLIEEFNVKGSESWFFNCESMKVEDYK